jgi:pyruvate dehydrogenase E2 component (dihydrolipoamide acetyltransferase)
VNAAARLVEVRVPDMGNFKDVAVIDVLVKPGEAIEPETPLVTLETEKATMDVPSTASGVIERVHVEKGGKVSAGDLIATVRSHGAPAMQVAEPAGAASSPAAVSPARVPPSAPPAAAPQPVELPGYVHAGPSVRKLARELGVDLGRVAGQGFKGRITPEDVKSFIKGAAAKEAPRPAAAATAAPATQRAPAQPDAKAAGGIAWPAVPAVDFSQFGPTEVQALTRIQRISGPRLHASWVNIPHVTQFEEADITELEETRNRLKDTAAQAGVKLTLLAFVVRACVRALRVFPQVNASLDPTGTNLILKKYFHIGFAADTPNGLIVPVIRDADQRDVYGIARQLTSLSEKARTGKLAPPDMQGGCFTISSLGGIGGTAFTPIINAPEVAILGISRSAVKPIFIEGKFVPRLMLPLSFSYDHRVIDGALAARFTTFLAETLAEPRGLTEALS